MLRLAIAIGVAILVTGCNLLPDVYHEPTLHNPFPQLTKVAVAPFINASTEPSVNGRQFGLAYGNELQLIHGFEVVPMGVVEHAMRDHHLSLDTPADVRRLAQFLEVDAVVVGVVTDFTPYYPPRCGIQVEWYAANPCFHPIPVGYGLPWGTPEEEDIPKSLVEETEMGLAREQLKTQTPQFDKEPPAAVPARRDDADSDNTRLASATTAATASATAAARPGRVSRASATSPVQDSNAMAPSSTASGGAVSNSAAGGTVSPAALTIAGIAHGASAKVVGCTNCGPPEGPHPAAGAPADAAHPQPVLAGGPDAPPGLPPDWPDPRGLVPPMPQCNRPECHPSNEPVLRQTRTYHGNDPEFTAALQSYIAFRDDARFGGWAAYLQRSDDFIRFCCHMHIAEMLTARGGAGETRVVYRWAESRYIP